MNRPIITEKSLGLASRGWYTFAVDKHARKEEVAKEIEKMYHVNVRSVRMVAMHGKVRRAGKKMMRIRKADWKKAIALLKSGQHIDAFEVTSKEEEKKAEKIRPKADQPLAENV
ncbi:MAG: 50S ribosomal protein L23 [Candidatus Gottesmanbacteria bacterium GW2011_GWB1_49_7]|uniref:Large ribosomal subunit protein uL23 n=1 Tax=Candidatus Gottesmanbacteria bacterium GW2011_GWB1_49_7 TaxID=1618448 RepID=A0A0G1YYI8_9BACT|nr:MAG: 50S ribosomal protein L23 [Candidatus Gottesmanbacteria bacterium GW2011_GWB1_49_7]